MKINEARIFLSYARKDVAEVNALYDQLKRMGFSPWQDHKDILPGQKWLDAIFKAIRESPFFLACLSNNSVNKRGVIQREVNEALDILREKLSEDIYLIPVRLEECPVPEELTKFQWVDLFEHDGFDKLIKALRHGLKQLGISAPLNLRSQPNDNLSPAEAAQMIRERNFYDRKWWPNGRGLHHEYEPKTINGNKVIVDHTTGLMWQQAGSDRFNYEKAEAYIKRLNRDEFAGFSNWRLPTLEEAMSLMEARQNQDNGLYVHSLFNKQQRWIWTADKHNLSDVLYVIFYDEGFFNLDNRPNNYYVRAVRSESHIS